MKKKFFLPLVAILMMVGLFATVPAHQPNLAARANTVSIIDSSDSTNSGMSNIHVVDTKKDKNGNSWDDYLPWRIDGKEYTGDELANIDASKLAAPGWHPLHPIASLFNTIMYIGSVVIKWIGDQVDEIMPAADGANVLKMVRANTGGFIRTNGYLDESPMFYVSQFFHGLSWFMLGIGAVFGIAESAIAYSNGSGSPMQTVINFFKGVAFTLGFIPISAALFWMTIGNNGVASKLRGLTGGAPNILSVLVSMCSKNAGVAFLSPILTIILCFIYFSYCVEVAMRYLTYIGFVAESSVMPFALARGTGQGETSNFLLKYVRFLIGMTLQVWSFYFGANLMMQGNYIVGGAFMVGAERFYSLVGAPSVAPANVLGTVHNALCSLQSAGRVAGGIGHMMLGSGDSGSKGGLVGAAGRGLAAAGKALAFEGGAAAAGGISGAKSGFAQMGVPGGIAGAVGGALGGLGKAPAGAAMSGAKAAGKGLGRMGSALGSSARAGFGQFNGGSSVASAAGKISGKSTSAKF